MRAIHYKTHRIVRLWIGDEDYGLMSERIADMYLSEHRRLYPDEPYRIEPIDDLDAELDKMGKSID